MVNTWKHGISQVRRYDPYGPGDVAKYLSKGRFSSAADCEYANTYELRKFHRADWDLHQSRRLGGNATCSNGGHKNVAAFVVNLIYAECFGHREGFPARRAGFLVQPGRFASRMSVALRVVVLADYGDFFGDSTVACTAILMPKCGAFELEIGISSTSSRQRSSSRKSDSVS